MHILILYLVLNCCGTKKFTQFLKYFLSIKNFKHLHEKVLERDMHAHMQDSYACLDLESTATGTLLKLLLVLLALAVSSNHGSFKLILNAQLDLKLILRSL